jgi:transmembrane protein TMEM260 (protein O-mannosyltransferase)
MAFLAAFVVYLATLCPTVWVGDSGELTAAAWTLGIPHPTGYPLWLLLAKAFAAIVPFGSVAWRVNLFSAVCAAGAAQFTSASLRRLGTSRAAAFGGAMALALLVPIWGEATVARTYPLAALASSMLLWLTVKWMAAPCGRTIVGHQLLLGYGLANHPMVAAHLPALVAVVLGRERSALKKPKLIAWSIVALVPGLMLYSWLTWRASAHPPLDYHPPVEVEPGKWRPAQLDTVEGFKSYLTREFHQSHHWAQGLGDQVTIVAHHLKELALELSPFKVPLGVLFALIGSAALWRGGRRSLVVAIALLWIGNLAPLSLHGAWWDIFLYSRYLTTGFVGVALLVGVGLDATIRFAGARWPAAARAPVAIPCACVLPLLLLVANWRACDRRDGWLAEDYAKALLAEVPDGAQFLSGDDSALYPLLALHFTAQLRPDVQLVNPVQLDGDADLLLALRARKNHVAPPATVRPAFSPDFTSDFEGLVRERHGLVYRLRLPDEPPPADPPAPFTRPPIRGLDRDDERDPFARSVIARIESDLADAAAVRGDDAQMRARLERVARLAAPRPWGNMLGIATLLARVEARGASKGSGRDSLDDLALARRLVDRALEAGDARDAVMQHKYKEIGAAHYAEAIRLRPTDPASGLDHLVEAADLLRDVKLCKAAVEALVKSGKADVARTRLERWLADSPNEPTLNSLLNSLPH